MRLHLPLALAASLALAAPAATQGSIDLADYTCADLAQEDDETFAMMLIWADGYLTGRTGDTRFDVGLVEAMSNRIAELCEEDQWQSLITVLERLLVE